MTLTNNIAAKLSVAFVAVAMAFTLAAPMAHAQDVSNMTVEEMQALINQLLAQLGQSNTTAGSCEHFYADMGKGASGPDVMRLQQFLNMDAETRVAAAGVGSPGQETQYYGSLTAAAVSKFQVKYRAEILTPLGLVNPTGYFGASSRAKANAICDTGSGDNGGDNNGGDNNGGTTLEGGAGSITDSSILGEFSNEEVGEGQDDVEVFGLEVEPAGSDIEITAINVDFDKAASGNSNFDKYASDVTIWVDGEKYATVDADEFNRDNEYGKTITLDRGAIIREGDKGEIVVAVSGINNLDSNDASDQWDVGIDSLRYRDALGASITDSSSTGIGGNNDTTTVATNERTLSFENFATAANLEVKLRAGDSDINTARTIEVSSTTKTSDEDVFSFGVEVDGGSTVMVDDIRVDATTTTAVLNNVISTAYLYMDGDRVGSENITSTDQTNGYITFNDLNLDLDEGTHDFVVKVDFKKADGSNYSTGETISMDLTSSDRSGWYIEDENGDEVASGDFTGTVSGDDMTLRTQGLNLDLASSSSSETYNSTTPSSSYGTFTMNVELTAVGETMYVPQTVAEATTASSTAGATFSLQDSSGAAYTSGTSTKSFTYVSGGTVTSNDRVRIDEGQTATFKLVVTLDPAASGQYRAQFVGSAFNTSDAIADTAITASPSSDFRSGYQLISN